MKRPKSPLCLFALGFLMLVACGEEDDYEYPSVKLEFLTAYSDADGYPASILTDAGERFAVVERTSPTTTTPDSTIRIVSNYEPMQAADGTQGIKLYGWAYTLSPLPKPESSFEEGVKSEPAEMLSSWMGIDYVNILLEVKQQGKHIIDFVEQEVTVDEAAGHATVNLLLYHDVASTVQDYTKRAYLSVPLWPYLSEGVERLAVNFTLTTSDGSRKTYTYEYIPER